MKEWTGAMTEDSVVKIDDSVIQHGTYNNRVYLMNLGESNISSLIKDITDICLENSYTKVFAKVPAEKSVEFLINGYRIEAFIPGYFSGQGDVLFMAKYFSDERSSVPFEDLAGFQAVIDKESSGDSVCTEKIELMTETDTDEMAALYGRIFPTYPFPITDAKYLESTMRKNIYYYGIRINGKLAALSSAETCRKDLAVEMTDFAVLPEYRGKNMSSFLLEKMENDMAQSGFKTFYTIARLKSIGMNLTFLKNDYKYSGTLINNTNISGSMESMNVLYKNL